MNKIFLLLFFTCFSTFLIAQTYPVVITNSNQGGATLGTLNIMTDPNSGTLISTFDVDSKLVATQSIPGHFETGSNGTSGSTWYKVDLPGSSGAVAGYVMGGSTYSNSVCGFGYVTVLSSTINIRPSAGTTTSWVQVNGANGHVFPGQEFAVVGSTSFNGVIWYEIYLTNSPYCSQRTGWIAGATTAPLVTYNTSSSNGLSTPVLSSSSYTGTSVNLSWTMDIQPTGALNTSFAIYRAVNGGVANLLTTISSLPPNLYTDATLSSSNSYSYYVVANYGSCSSQPSNIVSIGSGGGCSTVLNPTSASTFPTSGGSGSFSINVTPNSCPWSASTSQGWIHITAPTSGTGYATLNYTIDPNTGPPQNGTITVNGQIYSISQSGVTGCSTALNPTSSPTIPASGGGGSFSINVTPNSCSWSASTSQGWIHITSPTSGTGYATLNYTVDPNTGQPQNGTITVNGQIYSITENGTAVPTTYTITGRVVTSTGTGIPNVNVTTPFPQPQYSGITDANGNYSITNVPNSYSGSVSASLINYTFTPPSLTVSSTNNSGKNFTSTAIPPASINITSSEIPPWQREKDDFSGLLFVNLNNAQGNPWYLEIDIFNPNGTYNTHVDYIPSTTSNFISFNSKDPQLSTLINSTPSIIVNGCKLTYSAVLGTPQNHLDVKTSNKDTKIIERKWDKENKVLYSSQYDLSNSMTNLNIPLKYLINARKIKVSFDIDRNTCSYSLTGGPKAILLNGSMPFTGEAILTYDPNTTKYIRVNSTSSNILKSSVFPGEWTCLIQYLDANGNLIPTQYESETFELTKCGKANSNGNSQKIVVFIGGWNNTIEDDISNLTNADINSNSTKPFSLTKYSEWTNNGFETWYIAQSGTNYTQRNAYSIGVALDSILKLKPNIQEIDLITHSKGGLDVRAYLGGYAKDYKNFNPSLSNHIDPNGISFNSFQNHSKIKKVIFLTVPNNGANYTSKIANLFGGSPAIKELSKQPDYGIINELNLNGIIPDAIFIGNLTAYEQVAGGFNNNGINVTTNTWFNFTDGIVDGESSDCISNDPSVLSLGWPASKPLHYSNGSNVPILQMYQHAISPIDPRDRVHTIIHESNTLRNYLPTVYSIINQINSSIANLDKVVLSINHGFMPSIPTCPRPTVSRFTAALIKSKLSGAKLFVKFKNENQYLPFGITDENGRFNGTVVPSLLYWDSIKIEANGVETMQVPINSEVINSNKLNVAMFKSSAISNKVQYPSFSLVNQNPITSLSSIPIKITAQNASQYLINLHSSDSVFVPLKLNNSIANIQLDSGYNLLMVKFIGIDTAIQYKEVFYLPGNLLDSNTNNLSIQNALSIKGIKMFVNNIFSRDIDITSLNSKILLGNNEIKFSRYGYRDTMFKIDTSSTIQLQMQPYSYSSLTDSSIYNFNNGFNPQYWKNISVKNITNNIQLSAKQYDDVFPNMGLIPQCRKFVFRNLTSNSNVKLRTAIALDQIDTPDSADVYLLTIKNGQYKKYRANQTNVSEYDPEVQKVAFDSISLGANQAEEIVLMKKQPPIMKLRGADTIYSGQPNKIALSNYVADPDSIKGDIDITITNVSAPASDVQFTINGGVITVIAGNGFTGDVIFTLSATHDFITVNKTFILKVLPTSVQFPNAFTPNNDGLNDVFRPRVYGHVVKYHLLIYNRYGEKVFETFDYNKGWDGRVNGAEQQTTVFVWALTYQLEGKVQENKRGSVTLIR